MLSAVHTAKLITGLEGNVSVLCWQNRREKRPYGIVRGKMSGGIIVLFSTVSDELKLNIGENVHPCLLTCVVGLRQALFGFGPLRLVIIIIDLYSAVRW